MNPDTCSLLVEFADIRWRNQTVSIEYQWVGRERVGRPLWVLLHEGLGSVALWQDFPSRLCATLDCQGLIYSRPGYGQSSPRAPNEHWGTDFMHQQAYEVLPALLETLGVDPQQEHLSLLGHSDGGSIALLYAARFAQQVAATVVLAPHIMVEEVCLKGIARARKAYLESGLRQRLVRFHRDPDSAFWGWNDAWLDPAFASWTIESELPAIMCPLLAIQGLNDEYGTLEQIRGIARRVPQTELIELPDCRHSPHRDQTQRVIEAVHHFFQHHSDQSTPLGDIE